jgi:pyridoxine kinase
VRKLMDRLTDLGAKTIVITGVSLEPGKTGVVGMDTATGKTYHYFHPHFKGQFHGTGDIFSSSVVGALMNGRSLDEALRISANFTYECIRRTAMDENASWYGVNFEKALPYLIDQLREDGQRSSMRF